MKRLTKEQRAWAILVHGGSIELPKRRKLISEKTSQVLAGALIGAMLTLLTIIALSF